MAYNRNTLPALKLTQRPTFGSKSVGTIHRGHSYPDKASRELLDQSDHVSPSCQYEYMTLDDFIPTATVLSMNWTVSLLMQGGKRSKLKVE